MPTVRPSSSPTVRPTVQPSAGPTDSPSVKPSAKPSLEPSVSVMPSVMPSAGPSVVPSFVPSFLPTSYTVVYKDQPTRRYCNNVDVQQQVLEESMKLEVGFMYGVEIEGEDYEVLKVLQDVEESMHEDLADSLLDCNNSNDGRTRRLNNDDENMNGDLEAFGIDSLPVDEVNDDGR